MPFEQKYTPETKDASLSRVLERREAEPGNRSIIRETAEEFSVGEQSLRGWIRAHEKSLEPDVVVAPAPAPAAALGVEEPETLSPPAEAPARRGRPSAAANAASDSRVAELEAEVAKLRRDRETLKNALAVLLSE